MDVLKKRAPALYSVWGHQGSPRITVVPLRCGISHDSTIEVSEFVRKLMNLAYSLDFVSPGNILKIDHLPDLACIPFFLVLESPLFVVCVEYKATTAVTESFGKPKEGFLL